MATLGLVLDDVAADLVVELWPENIQSVQVFMSVQTQWRVGPGGLFGLDYNVIPFALEMSGIKKSKWPQVMDDIRILESAAVEEMRGG